MMSLTMPHDWQRKAAAAVTFWLLFGLIWLGSTSRRGFLAAVSIAFLISVPSAILLLAAFVGGAASGGP
jgi:hypothetical protein